MLRKSEGARRVRRSLISAGPLAALLLVAIGTTALLGAEEEPRLRDLFSRWLETVQPLITQAERQELAALEETRDQERFILDFWARRPHDSLERWSRNRKAALEARHRAPIKATIMQALGKPERKTVFERCSDQLRKLELWHYEKWQIEYQLGFLPARAEPFTIAILEWSNLDPRRADVFDPSADLERWGYGQSLGSIEYAFDRAVASRCLRPAERETLENHLADALTLEEAIELMPWPQPSPSEGSEERWPTARLLLEPVGRFGSQSTILRGSLSLPSRDLALGETGQLIERITVTGDVRRRGRFESSFEITHLLTGAPPDDDRVTLDLFRSLRPGSYELDIRVTDRFDRPLLRERRTIEILRMENKAEPPPDRAGGFSRLTRAELMLMTAFPTLELLEPRHPGSESSQVILAVSRGGKARSVEFLVDGAPHSVDQTAPFVVELETEGKTRTIEARAIGLNGELVARAERVVLPPDRPFSVELSPRGGADGPLVATIVLPHGEVLASFRCYEGQSLVATAKPPAQVGAALEAECPAFERTTGFRFMRVLVELESGAQAEDVYVISPRALEEVDVRIAQLALSVQDKNGAPIPDLQASELTVSNSGREVPIVRFETVDRLPLHLTLLLDTSSSMGRRLRVTSLSSQRFFEDLLREQDAASLIAFNHDIRVLAPFTSDKNQLRYGASELSAWGSTRLYDGMMHSLSFFDSRLGRAGPTGRRALVVLTDGADVGSDSTVENLERELIGSSVAVYAVALGNLAQPDEDELTTLARRSGGALFHAKSASQLDAAFRRIATLLRSQYLVAIRPDSVSPGEEATSFEVEVERAGARVSALTRIR